MSPEPSSFLGAERFDDLGLFGGLTHYLPPMMIVQQDIDFV